MEKARRIAHLKKLVQSKIKLADWYERKGNFGAVDVLEGEIAHVRKQINELM